MGRNIHGRVTFRDQLHVQPEPTTFRWKHNLLSQHDHVLIYDSTSDHRKGPLVTLDDYCKWYEPSVIEPSGNVTTAFDDKWSQPWSYALHCMDRRGLAAEGDHLWHPALLCLFAHFINGSFDLSARASLTGRWLAEHGDDPVKLMGIMREF